MNRQWLWMSIPVALIGLAILPFAVIRLLNLVNDATLVSLPLVQEQTLHLETTGSMLLHGEGPRFTTAFGKLEFELTFQVDNKPVELNPVYLKSSSSGITHSRLSLRAFDIEYPGEYQLKISGLDDNCKAQEKCLIAITRDNRRPLVGTIVAIVFSAIAFLSGSIISAIVFLRCN